MESKIDVIAAIKAQMELGYGDNPRELLDMVFNGTSKFKNPAYNKKYRKQYLKGLPTENIIIDVVENSEGNIIKQNLVPTFVGAGGFGSNIMYALQHVKVQSGKYDDRMFPLEFFDFDKWEIKNLPRIPYAPESMIKRVGMGMDKVTTSDKEDNFNDSLFYMGCWEPVTNTLPVGAYDTQTKNWLHDAIIPSLYVGHRDNKIVVDTFPQGTHDDVTVETYGTIHINFLIPAFRFVSLYVYEILKGERGMFPEVLREIEEFKDAFREYYEQSLSKHNGRAFAQYPFEAKYDLDVVQQRFKGTKPGENIYDDDFTPRFQEFLMYKEMYKDFADAHKGPLAERLVTYRINDDITETPELPEYFGGMTPREKFNSLSKRLLEFTESDLKAVEAGKRDKIQSEAARAIYDKYYANV